MEYTITIEVYGSDVQSVRASSNTPALLADLVKRDVKTFYEQLNNKINHE